MRTPLALITLILLSGSLWLLQQKRYAAAQLDACRNSMDSIMTRNNTTTALNRVSVRFGEKPFETSDSILEIHRLVAVFSNTVFLLRIELRPDSAVSFTLKKCTVKNELTGNGEDKLLGIRTEKVDFPVYRQFMERLAKIEFQRAVVDEDIMCCFGGGSLQWEAILKDHKRRRFRTFCRQSVPFAEACEFVFKQIDDPELNHYFR